MTADLLKRLSSFIVDFTIIMLIIWGSYTIVGGRILNTFVPVSEIFEELAASSEELTEELDTIDRRWDMGPGVYYENEEEYLELRQTVEEEYNEAYTELFQRWLFAYIYYFVITFTTFNFLYHGFTKGRTFGRKLFKLRLSGRVNWWSIFMREVIWKSFFWLFMLTLGAITGLYLLIPFGIIIDIVLIAFTRDKKTLRDTLTHTRVILDDVVYPF